MLTCGFCCVCIGVKPYQRECETHRKLLVIDGRALSLQRLHSLPQLRENEALLLQPLLLLVGPQQVHILLQSLCCLAQLLQLLHVVRPF